MAVKKCYTIIYIIYIIILMLQEITRRNNSENPKLLGVDYNE